MAKTFTADTVETALTILAESDRSGRGHVVHTADQFRDAMKLARELETIERGFKRREEDRCSFPLDEARQAAYDRADQKAEEKAAALLKPYRMGAKIGGDVRGSQIHLLTPRTGRANTMGGREAGWAV